MYIAEVFTKDDVSVDHVEHRDIASVFVEIENPIGYITSNLDIVHKIIYNVNNIMRIGGNKSWGNR